MLNILTQIPNDLMFFPSKNRFDSLFDFFILVARLPFAALGNVFLDFPNDNYTGLKGGDSNGSNRYSNKSR